VSPYAVLWLAVAGLVVTCSAAVGARSLAQFSRHELEEICRRRKSPVRLGQILRRHDLAGLAAETLQVIATAVLITAVAFWIWITSRAGGYTHWGSLAASVGVVIPTLLAAEIWIPFAVARLWAEPFLYHTWPFWQLLSVLLAPLVWGARFVDTVLHRSVGRVPDVPDEESFEDEIRTIVTEGHREGLLEEDAREMIEGVIELSDVVVSEIMTPRTDMVSLPISLSRQEMLDAVVRVRHTRIPVYDKNRDDIVGILYTKDLLPELAKSGEDPVASWTSLLREPSFVPETKPVDVLLQEFRRTRNHLVVVLDEYGGVSGVVSMEDVLEEIVGEIVDESDKDLVDGIREIDHRTAEALGKVHVDEVNDRLDLELPDDGDFDTIGGFVFTELGHVPTVGEELVYKNVRLTVVEATRRRIERVRIEMLDRPQRDTA
jgi:CBS domain containing-hemolysin-like protein